MKDDVCTNDVCSILLEITSAAHSNIFNVSPFVFLEGSSGSGKSQMAFAIQANIKVSRLVFYFLFLSPSAGDQQIYLNFQNISSLFSKCVDADARIYAAKASAPSTSSSNENKDYIGSSCQSLFQESLYVFGFIYELLLDGERNGSHTIAPKTGQNVVELMKHMGIQNNRPIFIIDECVDIKGDSLKKVRFVRNCFRSLGLGLVILGTDSRAADMPDTLSPTSRSEQPKPWCHMICRFPAVNLSLINLPQNSPDWLKLILTNSRPLFSQLVSSHIQSSPQADFESLLRDVFIDLTQRKKIFANPYGKLGQVHLFQNGHYSIDLETPSTGSPLIHSHFAQLEGEGENFVLNDGGCLTGCGESWRFTSVFPKPEKDILLYMLLMGGKEYPAFCIAGKVVPYANFLLNITSANESRSTIVNLKNKAQVGNDGNFLESLLCSTVCLASHSNGLAGIGLKQFLLNLLFQIQLYVPDPTTNVLIGGLETLAVDDFTIPFLSPPNQKWPLWLSQVPSSNFGSLERPKDEAMIDLRTSCGLTGEAKDYGKRIDLSTMQKILSRIPADARVELVYTRKLQVSYFNRGGTFNEKFSQSLHLLQGCFLKIDASKPSTSLESIKGLPSSCTPECLLVIFFEIHPDIKMP